MVVHDVSAAHHSTTGDRLRRIGSETGTRWETGTSVPERHRRRMMGRIMLEDVLVLDLSRVLAGPYCTMMLADLGARVIKVEHPDGGDVTRSWGPPFDDNGESAYFQSINRNKESIALDLKSPAGVRAVERLAARADVLVENFPPQNRIGLDLAKLRRENPRLIVASISGFGAAGPDRNLPGFDLLAQAAGGLMAITGHPEGAPCKVGVAISDLAAGANAAIGILAALHERERTGRASWLRIDLFSSTVALLVNVLQSSLRTGHEASRYGNAHPQIVPYQLFAAADGDFILAVGTDRQFRLLCERVIRRPELAASPSYATNPERVRHREQLVPELAAIFRSSSREDWLSRCREAGVPAGPVQSPLEAARSSQADSLGLLRGEDGFTGVASPIRSEAPERWKRPPHLDEQGPSIRKEFGLESGSRE
jgi:glutaryl-CoA transferase